MAPLLAYLLLVRLIERRKPAELAPRKLLPHSLAGLAIGFALVSAVVGSMAMLGAYHVDAVGHQVEWWRSILDFGIGTGIGEEVLYRLVLFRIIEEGAGTWYAMIISSLWFGMGHTGNPDATTASLVAIVVSGVLFCLLYHVSRSAYACIGVHAALNLTEGLVWGIPVSGFAINGLLISHRTGPDWLSGGAFGAEASVLSIGCWLLASVLLFELARRRQTLVAPSWRRTS